MVVLQLKFYYDINPFDSNVLDPNKLDLIIKSCVANEVVVPLFHFIF